MSGYEGQPSVDFSETSIESNQVFDEKVRKNCYEAINSGEVTPELLKTLVDLSHEDSHQATYFIGKFIMDGLIKLPEVAIREERIGFRGDAGPGYTGIVKLGPYARRQADPIKPIDVSRFFDDPAEEYDK